jgi:FAD:protein FMN transferase
MATTNAATQGEVSLSFRAMNTDVLGVVVVPDDGAHEAEVALGQVKALFAQVEATLSRFRPESDLSKLNAAAGTPYQASPMLFDAVDLALRAARESEGVFDPTILSALVGAGYDRSFELLAERDATPRPAVARSGRSWRDIKLDHSRRLVHLPAGCGIDLGGIGKGWTVDLARQLLRPFEHFVVDAGGDIYAAGTQADGDDWTIAVDDPRRPGSDLCVLRARDRALATSTVVRRHWRQGGQERHHLIDPRTGAPAVGDVLAATVVADTVARAESLAKVALILGRDSGVAYLGRQHRAAALLALTSGEVVLTDGFEELCDGA